VIVVDTGVLYAAVDRDDADHAPSAGALLDHAGSMLVPVPVIVETSWLIESRLGADAEVAFLHAVEVGEIVAIDLEPADWSRVAELVEPTSPMRWHS
jgi:predicted nucleic acid-binding protein